MSNAEHQNKLLLRFWAEMNGQSNVQPGWDDVTAFQRSIVSSYRDELMTHPTHPVEATDKNVGDLVDGELREQIEHMFVSAWQDGVNHLNPKYLRRDTIFTNRIMQLFVAHLQAAVRDTEINILGRLIPNFDGVDTIGYQYDDGSRISVDARLDQVSNDNQQVKQPKAPNIHSALNAEHGTDLIHHRQGQLEQSKGADHA